MPEKKKQELKDRAPIVAAYLRVSTDKQTILNQKSEVINFCHRQELKITMWCTETVSGTKKESERELGILLKKLQKGDVYNYRSFPAKPENDEYHEHYSSID